jgi:hypothetical protein
MPLVDGRRPTSFDEAGRLVLAVEFLSPSSARADRVYRTEKKDLAWLSGDI